MPENQPTFYVTTPIYYVNARPHIGHAYTTIVADVLARRHRLLGDDTFFLTGTDEHGQKIERSAAAAGIPPQQFTDEVSAEFKQLWDRMGLTYNRFIRTTDPNHKRGAQKLFAELYKRGAIYLSSYTGQYCVSEEIFVEGPPGTIGPDGKPTETVTEENFFFRLSQYQRPLLDLIESDTLKITPESRKNEILSFLRGKSDVDFASRPELHGVDENGAVTPTPESIDRHIELDLAAGVIGRSQADKVFTPGALRDLSVSRSSFTWGIPVPDEIQHDAGAKDKHVMYVWLDALANYMTAVGYGDPSPQAQAEYTRYWPADVHIMAKEITRQHCIYWPAFLLAADLPTPKAVTAHGWLLFDNAKMSKSKGNIVRTETILDAFGDHVYGKQFPESTKHERDLFATDVLRYFLLREIPFGQDGSFSFDALITRYNADLANGYGNLVSRTLNLIAKTSNGAVEDCLEANSLVFYQAPRLETPNQPERPEVLAASEGQALGWAVLRIAEAFNTHMERNSPTEALAAVNRAITAVDGFITSRKPWAATDTDLSQGGRRSTLYTAAESIRIITALLYPILPYATAQVWAQLGLGDIEQAARNGDLNNLEWGGLKPGTKLGPLAPIFPRADKGLAQTMIDMEESRSTTQAATTTPEQRPEAPLKDAATPTPAASITGNSSDPAAAPRTSSLDEPTGALTVGGSSAKAATLPTTPGPHTEAQGSGPFAAPQTSTSPTAGPTHITLDDFLKVELRVAQVLVAERIPKADKLLRLEVDLGTERRQILSGIAEWYTPEELIGRRIVVVANLAPRKMRGLESHGMLLAASEGQDGKPILATFGEDIALGSRVR